MILRLTKSFLNSLRNRKLRKAVLLQVLRLDKRSSHIDLVIRLQAVSKYAVTDVWKCFFSLLIVRTGFWLNSGKTWDESDPDIITITGR